MNKKAKSTGIKQTTKTAAGKAKTIAGKAITAMKATLAKVTAKARHAKITTKSITKQPSKPTAKVTTGKKTIAKAAPAKARQAKVTAKPTTKQSIKPVTAGKIAIAKVAPAKATPAKVVAKPTTVQPIKPTAKPSAKVTAKPAAKSSPAKKADGIDLTQELIEGLVEKGRRSGSMLSYEEVMEFSDRNHLSDQETNDLLKLLEKENVELVMQEEIETDAESISDFEKEETASKLHHIKSHLETSLDFVADEELEDSSEDEEEPREVVKEPGEATHISDGVKCYLRDIGKIPLLNKKTESVIAEQIATGKRESIEAISKFPFIHKEIVGIGEKLSHDAMLLKDIIQFSEFDEENLPNYEEEKKALLSIIN